MTTIDSTRGPSSWAPREVVAATALVAVGVVIMRDAWWDIVHFATRDEEQSHILLVPIIAAWLVWIRRARLRRCPRDGCWIGPATMALGWVMYSVGDLYLVQALWHLGAIVVAIGGFLTISGRHYLARLLPAFMVLAVMVPVPGVIRQQIALPLQAATAEATQRVLDILGVTAARTGNALSVNGLQIFVAEACNGLRMVFALSLVSYAFAYSSPIREPVRILIIAASPLTAIVCNVIRLVPTVWIYGYVSVDAGKLIHDLGGWVMLPVAFLLLMGIFRTLRWALVPVYRYTLAYGK